MGSDAFRSLFTLYQTKTKVADQVEQLEQLQRRLSQDIAESSSLVDSQTHVSNPQVQFELGQSMF